MRTDLDRATVIGAGAMGTLCAQLLAIRGTEVFLWGRDADLIEQISQTGRNPRYLPGVDLDGRVSPESDSTVALSKTQLIISAVPCQFMRPQWIELAREHSITSPVVSVAKGIEVQNQHRPSQVLREILGPVSLAVMSGPSLAGEIAAGLPAAVVVASEDDALAHMVQKAFSSSRFRVYTNRDVIGVELAGAVKNVIALAAGIADGLEMGNNAKAGLVTRGLAEMARLGVALGGSADTFRGLAGMGDLMTTCYSGLSRNHVAGEKIGRGMNLEDVVQTSAGVIEGIQTTKSVLQMARQHEIEMPITQGVHAVLFEGRKPQEAIDELMTRRLKAE